MAEQGSRIVVYAALAGNVAIAVTKFGAAALTGAGSMLTEGVHSAVDSLDQLLLLVGQARGARPADDSHPLGHGLEVYFWTFTVALMVFTLGGAFSVYEGIEKIRHAETISKPWVNAAVLAISFLFEGASFVVGYREYRKAVGRRRIGVFGYIRRSKDPNVFVSLVEDGAALTGLVLAGFGVAGAALFGWRWADGAASIAIGLLLMSVAAVLANETRSLITGESADPSVVEAVEGAIRGHCAVTRAPEVATLQLGPETILVAVTLDLRDGQDLERIAVEVTERVRGADRRIDRVYFRPSTKAGVASPEAVRA